METYPHQFEGLSPLQSLASGISFGLVADTFDIQSNASLASVPDTMSLHVLIRYLTRSPEAMHHAQDLAKMLATEGIDVADIRTSAAVKRTEIRYFYVPDEAAALRVGHLVDVKPARAAIAEDDPMPRPGTVQLNVSERQ